MVLEQMFKVSWIKKRPRHAFLMGIVYAIIGILSALLIFPKSSGPMSVGFIACILLLSINKLLQDEENVEIREKKFNILQLFKDHKDIFEIYLFLFLGIFTVYFLVGLILPQNMLLHSFSSQLNSAGLHGSATNPSNLFLILKNNLLVFAVCFLLSFIYGAGSIIFITWNASVWGIFFGYFIKTFFTSNILLGTSCVLIAIFPHMITEIISYFSASISGGVLSKASIREELFSTKFNHVLTDSLILLLIGFLLVLIAGLVEIYGFEAINTLLKSLIGC